MTTNMKAIVMLDLYGNVFVDNFFVSISNPDTFTYQHCVLFPVF